MIIKTMDKQLLIPRVLPMVIDWLRSENEAAVGGNTANTTLH